ncbi:bifunctional FO biosynthesis protein CofGH [Pimelobacter simplex]|uniref:FO synthase n=1 Tax=Nocardioides simplex TaxID=2045 RepID=A0A0A1DGW7_NOCSI|nr:bifunctional FO biosynthesis protein CofGH [Pimelobacter simplex]AIY16561.1 7,8-didemethyl-8-hydroxy-5-deazariboflavin synthase subunit 1 [Pimelobacter simplex]MCG8154244.1 bifunctional FO biosynthesis protein CofGH [Pimelobacter simplex]GEB11690.1 FO synthase [Pimelobacter simplex]SFN00502.1 FO synthase subunit 1 /FO synthase subunit 2 [Pimelobacter simplex]
MSEAPTPQQVRRALARAERGAALDVAEATALLAATGDELDRLTAAAAKVRDAGLVAAGRPGVVTYSPKVFIPITRLCRDRCHYCTFVETPAQAAREGRAPYLSPDEILDIARQGAELGCLEALFTLGDRPEDRWPEAQAWLDEQGYDSTLAYIRAMAVRVLEETGLLPHLNPGVMSWEELNRLKPVSPSMGMMLETTSRRLFETKGLAHFGSPDKDPEVRLRVLEDAGRLGIPFTTGLLVGIGETLTERAETIFALRATQRAYGAVQEVIVQNFRAKPDTAMRHTDDLGLAEYRAAIAVTRLLLGPKARIQAPPNLVDLDECRALLGAGVDDWGGVSPLTPDHVNPERPWPSLDRLRSLSQTCGFDLRARLTVHPEYVTGALQRGEAWIDPRLHAHVAALAGPDGLAIPEVRPTGLPWQEPDGGFDADHGRGRTDLHEAVDTEGRTDDRRSDFGSVYGDWAAVGEAAAITGAPAVLHAEGGEALRAAEADPGSLSDEHALTLMTAEGDLLRSVVRLADDLRRAAVGDDVTYVVNRNINFTNVCYVGCRFCAFAQRRTDADAYSLSYAEVADRAQEAWDLGATEVCMQGGIDPELPASAYFDIAAAVKQRVPDMHVHAFSPMEVVNGTSRTGLSIEDFLIKAREAGLGSLPGTAAEILDDEVRWVLTKGKLPARTWIEIVSTAHRIGLPTTSTMMYGHVDNPRHWVGHLNVLKSIQDTARENGSSGFTEFVPLPFVHTSAPIYLAGVARPGPTLRDNLAVHAMARILLHGRISNIQTSWVKLGVDGTRAMLNAGANDLGGTLMEETISRMAGSEHGSAKTVAELVEIGAGIERPVRERTTLYGEPPARPAPRP